MGLYFLFFEVKAYELIDDFDVQLGADPVLLLEPPKAGKTFESKDAGIAYLRAVARHQGYGLGITSHKPGNGVIHCVYLECSQAGLYESQAEVRECSTMKMNCKFAVSLNYLQKSGLWKVSFKKADRQSHCHSNHGPFVEPEDLAQYQRFTPEEREKISSLSNIGTQPRQIAAILASDWAKHSKRRPPLLRDIHNVINDHRNQWLKGRTPMEGLMDLVKAEKWASRVQTDTVGKTTHFFFASPDGIALARRFPTVIGIDSTYKTN